MRLRIIKKSLFEGRESKDVEEFIEDVHDFSFCDKNRDFLRVLCDGGKDRFYNVHFLKEWEAIP